MLNRWVNHLTLPVIAVTALQLWLVPAALARPDRVTPHVFPPNSSPYGHTYGEWSALFWQSLLAGPFDPEACSIGQSGNVLFLSATAGGPGEFECDVPVGTAFLISVLSGAFWCPDDCQPNACAPGGTIPELRECAGSAFDLGVVLDCDIDGVPINNLLDYRAQSPVFSGEIGPSNPFGLPAHPYEPAVADGVWVMVGPLRVGEHVIHFRAVIGDPPVFETESTHHITVVAGHGRDEGASAAVEPSTWGAIKATYR
jgi:hypothetical protein